ncbi:hypothetical protein, partial [Vibrio furnissii]|uniref:hypothetical protein n=1 Tax=Vibrio furnissii TaxID=29494 RepID=UPI001EEB0150
NLEPFELTDILKEEIVVDDGSIGVVHHVGSWATIWEAKPKFFSNDTVSQTADTIRFLVNSYSVTGVPICILSDSKTNNIQARMLSY